MHMFVYRKHNPSYKRVKTISMLSSTFTNICAMSICDQLPENTLNYVVATFIDTSLHEFANIGY